LKIGGDLVSTGIDEVHVAVCGSRSPREKGWKSRIADNDNFALAA